MENRELVSRGFVSRHPGDCFVRGRFGADALEGKRTASCGSAFKVGWTQGGPYGKTEVLQSRLGFPSAPVVSIPPWPQCTDYAGVGNCPSTRAVAVGSNSSNHTGVPDRGERKSGHMWTRAAALVGDGIARHLSHAKDRSLLGFPLMAFKGRFGLSVVFRFQAGPTVLPNSGQMSCGPLDSSLVPAHTTGGLLVRAENAPGSLGSLLPDVVGGPPFLWLDSRVQLL